MLAGRLHNVTVLKVLVTFFVLYGAHHGACVHIYIPASTGLLHAYEYHFPDMVL